MNPYFESVSAGNAVVIVYRGVMSLRQICVDRLELRCVAWMDVRQALYDVRQCIQSRYDESGKRNINRQEDYVLLRNPE